MTVRYLVLAASFLGLAGCGGPSQKTEETYARSVDQLGIFPVYPPREDLQVGDIYAVEVHSQSSRFATRTAFVGFADMTDYIRQYLSSRYVFADTTITDKSLALGQRDRRQEQGDLFAKWDGSTLPISAFPSIELDSNLSGDFSLTGGTVGSGSANAGRSIRMRLQFNGVSSYSVALTAAQSALSTYCGLEDKDCTSKTLASMINSKYMLGEKDQGYVKESEVYMVSKVYLAREIQYSFSDGSVLAAMASTQAPSESAEPKPVKSEPAAKPTQTAAQVQESPPETGSGDAQLAEALQQIVQSSVPNAQISVTGNRTDGYVLHQIFQRPVVVGYEAYSAYYPSPTPEKTGIEATKEQHK